MEMLWDSCRYLWDSCRYLWDGCRYLWDGFGYLDILSKARRRGTAPIPGGRRIAARRGFAAGGFLTISLENKNDFGILVCVLLHLKCVFPF